MQNKMRSRGFLIVSIFLFYVIVNACLVFALNLLDQDHFSILTNHRKQVVETDDISINGESAIREGSHKPIEGNKSIMLSQKEEGEDMENRNYDDASGGYMMKTMKYVRNIVNYILGFLLFLALVYFLIQGFKIITTNNENVAEEAKKSFKNASIAIAGIGLSWFIVSFIYYIIKIIVY